MDNEVVLGWTPIASQADLDSLMEAFDHFNDSVFVDLKYFSGGRDEFMIDDPSDETHCYVKFQSLSPNLAANTNMNEVVLRFAGIDQININSSKFDPGTATDVTLQFNDNGSIVLAMDTENSIELDDEGKTTPTFIIADTLVWSYDLGDDER